MKIPFFNSWVLYKSNSKLKKTKIQFPKLQQNQFLIKVNYTGFCASQFGEITASKGKDRYLPHCLGHEAIGQVVEKNSKKKIYIGDKVLMHWMKSKGTDSNKISYFDQRMNLINSGQITTFNEYAVVSENRVTKIECSKQEEQYFPFLGCSISVAISTLEKVLNISSKHNLLLLGCGAIGLPIIHYCKHKNIHIDVLDSKLKALKKARYFGSKEIYKKHINKKLIKKLKSNFYHFIIDTTGSAPLMNSIIDLTNKTTFCSVGVSNFKERLNFNPIKLNYGLKLLGSYGGNFNPDKDVKKYITFLRNTNFNFKKYIDKVYDLDEINSLIKDFAKGKIIGKALIKINHE